METKLFAPGEARIAGQEVADIVSQPAIEKRVPTRQHFEQENTEGSQIASGIKLLPCRLFKGHVARSTDNLISDGKGHSLGPIFLCQAKITQDRQSLPGDQNIGGLDIPMDNALLVQVAKRLQDLSRKLADCLRVHTPESRIS